MKHIALFLKMVLVLGVFVSPTSFTNSAPLKYSFEKTSSAPSTASKKNRTTARRALQYGRLFDNQMKTLKERGCPIRIISIFASQKNNVIATAALMDIGKKNIAFIPVIADPNARYEDLLELLEYKGTKARLAVNPATYKNINDIGSTGIKKSGFYFIFDVEDGDSLIGKNPDEASGAISAAHRAPLTVSESIALVLHTNVLERHGLSIVGSRWEIDPVIINPPQFTFFPTLYPMETIVLDRGFSVADYKNLALGTPSRRK